jgi:NAD(P)-dependent dehydrogenase (short-subunit alcohol dehydrogenase family)
LSPATSDLPRRFEGQVAIVTGAASGIGRATATRLAQEGAAVACLDVSAEALDAVVSELEAEVPGISGVLRVACDVTDEGAVRSAVTRTARELGRPSVVCNVAGIGGFEHSANLSLERFERVIAVNLTGTFLVCRESLPHLEDGGGCIVNVASTAGIMGQAYSAAYCASKGGVVMLTKALAAEYITRGVRVNAVAPGGVDTPLIGSFSPPEGADLKLLRKIVSPMGFASPDQIAASIAFLASDESSYTTGAILTVDGGITI